MQSLKLSGIRSGLSGSVPLCQLCWTGQIVASGGTAASAAATTPP